jgi:hypothetical protein
VHGVVGGSGPVPGLSAYPSGWIAAGARQSGLEFDRLHLQAITAPADPVAEARTMAQSRGIADIYGAFLSDRKGPARVADVAKAARLRVIRMGGYRPGSLSRVWRDLFGPRGG